MRLAICLADVPGSLASLLAVVAKTKANVLHIYHDRGGGRLSLYQSLVELELEVRNFEHMSEVSEALKAAGYMIELRKMGE
jgi:threonine dehydratase